MRKNLFIGILIFISASCNKWDAEEFPDLTASAFYSSTTIAPGQTINEVISINNTGGIATLGPIVFTVTNIAPAAGLTLSLSTADSITIGTDIYDITNGEWTITTTATEITFTSNAAIVIGPGYSTFIGLVITRAGAPNQGTDDAITQTISIQPGSGGGETPGNNNITTSTITKIKVPDLSASQFFSSLQISAGGTIEQVVRIRNLGTGPTTAPIIFKVTNYDAASGLSAVSNNNPSVTIGIDTYAITNAADWNVSVSTSELTFTSKTGVVLLSGSSKLVGITINRAAAPNQGTSGNVTHTVSIVPGTGGGETPVTNNTVFNTVVKL